MAKVASLTTEWPEEELPTPAECFELARYWREAAGEPPFPMYLECSRAWGRLAFVERAT